MSLTRRIFVSLPSDESLADHPSENDLKWGIVDEIVKLGYVPEIFRDSREESSGAIAHQGWSLSYFDEIIRRCVGCVIIGLPRWRLSDGTTQIRLASEFSHYEGAIAFSKRLPLLVIRQEGMQRRVFFDSSYAGTVATMPESADRSWLTTPGFRGPFGHWKKQLEARKDVFFGYCGSSAETARRLKQCLEEEVLLSVLDWNRDFTPGRMILSEIQEAADHCSAGIFLFTRDDKIGGRASGAVSAPRDNVVFEAGYFSSAKGKERVLIVREKGAKMPADLGGDIYAPLADASDIGPVRAMVERFIAAL